MNRPRARKELEVYAVETDGMWRLALWLVLTLGVQSLPGWADDRRDLAARLPRSCRLLRVSIARPWATLAFYDSPTEGPITIIYHRSRGGWVRVCGGGGSWAAAEIFSEGVPRRLWPALLGYVPPAFEVHRALSQGPRWPHLSQRELDPENLHDYSAWQLTLMRNEVFARHGRAFQDPELRAYFAERPWYKAQRSYRDSWLMPLEMQNVRTILEYQRSHRLLWKGW